MTVYDTTMVHSGPELTPGELWHLSLNQEPRGSPQDGDYHGGIFRANGIPRARMIHLLRRLARRLEEGHGVAEITMP